MKKLSHRVFFSTSWIAGSRSQRRVSRNLCCVLPGSCRAKSAAASARGSSAKATQAEARGPEMAVLLDAIRLICCDSFYDSDTEGTLVTMCTCQGNGSSLTSSKNTYVFVYLIALCSSTTCKKEALVVAMALGAAVPRRSCGLRRNWPSLWLALGSLPALRQYFDRFYVGTMV